MKCIENLKNYCVLNDIISENDADWFQYGIERRLTNILIGCPFFILALILTNISTSVMFFFSFYFLRCRINGFHAKSVCGCLLISLLCESFFLSFFYNTLMPDFLFFINFVCIALIFQFAPFKDSSFALTYSEYKVIKKSSRIRAVAMAVTACGFSLLGMYEAAKGITIGIAMAAFLLGLAYILNGGKSYEQTAGKN